VIHEVLPMAVRLHQIRVFLIGNSIIPVYLPVVEENHEFMLVLLIGDSGEVGADDGKEPQVSKSHQLFWNSAHSFPTSTRKRNTSSPWTYPETRFRSRHQ